MIRRMVEDLNVPVEIAAVPTVRETDGLALSSRNRLLTPEHRRAARSFTKPLNSRHRKSPLELTIPLL